MLRCDGRHTCGVKCVDRRGDRGAGDPLGGHGWNQFAAGERERTLQMAWIGAAIAAGLCEALGLRAVVAREGDLTLAPTE
jgi:hypothetical protein